MLPIDMIARRYDRANVTVPFFSVREYATQHRRTHSYFLHEHSFAPCLSIGRQHSIDMLLSYGFANFLVKFHVSYRLK